jgi:DNA helicase-2/ATP-dependent DNA helicase PcrA
MTRAREYLLLLNASARNTYGQFTDQISSRFLDEIPKKLIDVLDLESIYNPLQIKDIFQNWINNKLQLKPIPSPSKSNYARPATNNHSNSLNPKDTAAVEGIWKKNQTVKHAKFGTGIITGIEKATDNEYYLTIIFKAGQKKILSSFLSK